MNNTTWFSLVAIIWAIIWSTEVILAKLYIGEEVPFWMYGVQSLLIAFIAVKFIKW